MSVPPSAPAGSFPSATILPSLDAAALSARIPAFAQLLHACVHAGASIGFILPFSEEEAAAFWRDKILPGVATGSRILLAAEIDGRLAGTAQLGVDTPANQPHRAEVSKLLVHPDVRRRGIARMLMGAIEHQAVAHGRSLLTLDTRTGDTAEPLYTSLGYATAGVIPGYCRDPFTPVWDGTTVMYKTL